MIGKKYIFSLAFIASLLFTSLSARGSFGFSFGFHTAPRPRPCRVARYYGPVYYEPVYYIEEEYEPVIYKVKKHCHSCCKKRRHPEFHFGFGIW